ncbi:hypothetical protein BH11PSE11_BH11PSE11_32010 [soil metagenome]
MNKSILDSGIPLLTEIVKPVAPQIAPLLPPEPATARMPEQVPDYTREPVPERVTDSVPDHRIDRPLAQATEQIAPPALPAFISRTPQQQTPELPVAKPAVMFADAASTRLEQQISERVLQQMMGRIDHVLEQRVRDSLADVLQVAVEGLSTEIRTGLQEMLQEVISRAVSQEIARLQANRK